LSRFGEASGLWFVILYRKKKVMMKLIVDKAGGMTHTTSDVSHTARMRNIAKSIHQINHVLRVTLVAVYDMA
jgi:hypothetical protein